MMTTVIAFPVQTMNRLEEARAAAGGDDVRNESVDADTTEGNNLRDDDAQNERHRERSSEVASESHSNRQRASSSSSRLRSSERASDRISEQIGIRAGVCSLEVNINVART